MNQSVPVRLGDTSKFEKTISEGDIYGFAGITGDFAPPHVNEEFMKSSKFGQRVAHGALLVGFMSTASALLATRVIELSPGLTPMSIGYDRVRFIAPVMIGDTISISYEITEIDAPRSRSKANLLATNQKGDIIGSAQHIMKWLANP